MSLSGEPWELLTAWLPANDDPERPQMQLATVTAEGRPDVRTVLLTEFSPEGFWFHTDSRSRKAGQLQASSAVALLFLWPGFTRQLSVQGEAAVASREEIAAAYARRSDFLKQLAWQNTHDFAQLPQAERVARWQVFAEHADASHQPPTWTGYLVRPRRLTFWEGGVDTASLRTEFTATPSGWERGYLAG
jgi:pyridoxamine 5'-phosphate oxidase